LGINQIFDVNPQIIRNINQVIATKEIAMSLLILKKGWNIACLMPEYANVDFRQPYLTVNNDPCYSGTCFGRTLHPYEVIFYKNNRNVREEDIKSLSYITLVQQPKCLDFFVNTD
jgi:hypothetical protein